MPNNTRIMSFSKTAALAAVSALAISAQPAMAQAPARSAGFAPEEIIVTARKREESIMKTPVVVQAFSAQQIANLKIADFKDLASITPGLHIMTAFGTVGTAVYLRGLGNGEGTNFSDQAVLLNVDGLSFTHGAFFRGGMFDVAQIEVMKGPQALFFGRSTSAGLVAVTSADPTATWQSKATVGYEFNADEMLLDAYVSGPVTDKFGIRLAGYHNTMKGWMQNVNTTSSPVPARRIPDQTDDGVRLTLKYDDRDAGLRAKLKLMKGRVSSDMWSGDIGQHVCVGPRAVNTLLPFDNCKADNINQSEPFPNRYNPNVDWYNFASVLNGTAPAAFAAGGASDPMFTGKGYTFTDTEYAALSVDYDVADGLTVTSLTGYNGLEVKDVGRHNNLDPINIPVPPFGYAFDLAGRYTQYDFTQELRLTSDWKDSWFNFMLGGYYTTGSAKNKTVVNIPIFPAASAATVVLDNETYSAFGQVLLTPIDKWELGAGVRYTKVKKHIPVLSYRNILAGLIPITAGELAGTVPGTVTNYSEDNTSPEVTLTYRPTDDITAFVAYKHGYKGPGLNWNAFTGAYVPGQVNFYGGEKVKGVEGGIKASLLDRRLNVTASLYTYKYSGLQVSFYNGASFTTETANGADARVKGFELSTSFSPEQIEGLTLSGSVNYNHSNYTRFPGAPCFFGQTVGEGCTQTGTDAGGNPIFGQNLGGKQIHRAPRWTGTVGFDYRTTVVNDYEAALAVNSNFSSGYLLDSKRNPLAEQGSYMTFDATVRFGKLDGPWETALIVRNIGNKYIQSGGADDGVGFPGQRGDALVYVYRPRQIMLQLTVRPEIF